MRKTFCLSIFLILATAYPILAACTMAPGDRIEYTSKFGSMTTLPLVCTCDGAGGAIAATAIPINVVGGAQLVEVQVVPGATCAAVAATIRDNRIGPDSLGTKKWGIDAIDTTIGKNYGGHIIDGVFPVMDAPWFFTAGDLGADGSAIFYLKLSK
jgi:hypothetical protein